MAMRLRSCRKVRPSCLISRRFNGIWGWRNTCWARKDLPALHCRRQLTQVLIFPGRMKRVDGWTCWRLRSEPENPGLRTELENYLRQTPNDPVALTRLAELQQRSGNVDQAVKTYEKVVANDPLFAPAMRQLALLYGQLSTDSAKAYELVTKARQAYPDDPNIAKTLGILSYRRGYNVQAVELLKQASAKRKDDPELLYYLGEGHRQLKQWDECKEMLQRALTLNLSPGLADDARRALADCSEPSPG